MKLRILTTTITVAVFSSFAFAEDNDPIEAAMKFAHKAPKGEKKVSDRIIDGTASDDEVKKTVELYKLAAVAKPPKGDEAGYKEKFAKLLAATEDVAAKKDGAAAAYKQAVNCKACHSEHKPD